MNEVWVGVGGRANGIIQCIALAGYGLGSVSSSAGEELGLAKGAFPFSLPLRFLLAGASVARHPKEVLELLREVAVAIGVLA